MVNVVSPAFNSGFTLPPISDRVVGIAGLIVGVLSIIASIYFYKKSQQKAAPRYAVKDEELLDPSTPGSDRFKITFDEEPVKKAIRKATLAVWNAGNKTVHKSDVARLDPLRLAFPDNARIFTHDISSPARSANGFSKSQCGSDIIISFEYLDQRDGGVIEVLYEEGVRPEFKGSIIGIPEGFKSAAPLSLKGSRGSSLENMLPRWTWLTIIALASVGIYYDILYFANFDLRLKLSDLVQATIACALVVAIFLGRRQVRSTIPGNVWEKLR